MNRQANRWQRSIIRESRLSSSRLSPPLPGTRRAWVWMSLGISPRMRSTCRWISGSSVWVLRKSPVRASWRSSCMAMVSQRPSLVETMTGADSASAACRQVWRWMGARRITQVIRSTSVVLATASCTAQLTT